MNRLASWNSFVKIVLAIVQLEQSPCWERVHDRFDLSFI